MSDIKAVIFDFDGTLADTEKLYAAAFVLAVHDMGWEKTNGFSSDDDIYAFYCRHLSGVRWDSQRAFLPQFFPAMDAETYKRTYSDRCAQLFDEVGITPKPAASEIIDYVKSKNIKVGIASMTRIDALTKNCRTAGIDTAKIDCILGGGDVAAKPDPEIYLRCMSALGVSPSETIIVEDSTAGAAAGINSGAKTVIVKDSAVIPDDIAAAAAHVFEKNCLIALKTVI